jgi:hypothetical protein
MLDACRPHGITTTHSLPGELPIIPLAAPPPIGVVNNPFPLNPAVGLEGVEYPPTPVIEFEFDLKADDTDDDDDEPYGA